MAHTLYLSILLVMGLSTFNGPSIIWNSFVIFMSNGFNAARCLQNALSDPRAFGFPYISLVVVCYLHTISWIPLTNLGYKLGLCI